MSRGRKAEPEIAFSTTGSRTRSRSLAPLVTRINTIRRENVALQSDLSLEFHPVDNPHILCYSKSSTTAAGTNTILVAINLDPTQEQAGWIDLDLKVANDHVVEPLFIKAITKLTPEQVAAIPKKYLP